MKFRMRMLILVAVTVIVICTYLTVIKPDFSVHSDSANNDYIDIPNDRMDKFALRSDPKWVKAVHADYNSAKSTVSQNEGRLRATRLTVPERVNKYINIYQPKWNYHVNTTSPWNIASKWVTSRQIVGVEASELGMKCFLRYIVESVHCVIFRHCLLVKANDGLFVPLHFRSREQ